MSKIIEKPWNHKLNVLRAVFKGFPNLFSTSDVNRQNEIFNERLIVLEERLGLQTDMQLNNPASETPQIVFHYIYLSGCCLYEGDQTYDIPTTSYHIVLWYKVKNVTFEDDPTHQISGATFEDGSTMSAADHVVIDDWGLGPADSIPSDAHNTLEVARKIDGQWYLCNHRDVALNVSRNNRDIITLKDITDQCVTDITDLQTENRTFSNDIETVKAKLNVLTGAYSYSKGVSQGTIVEIAYVEALLQCNEFLQQARITFSISTGSAVLPATIDEDITLMPVETGGGHNTTKAWGINGYCGNLRLSLAYPGSGQRLHLRIWGKVESAIDDASVTLIGMV